MIPHFLWFSLASTAIPETLIPGSHRYSRNTVCLIPEQLRGIAVGSGNKRFGNTGEKRFGNKLECSQDQTDEPASMLFAIRAHYYHKNAYSRMILVRFFGAPFARPVGFLLLAGLCAACGVRKPCSRFFAYSRIFAPKPPYSRIFQFDPPTPPGGMDNRKGRPLRAKLPGISPYADTSEKRFSNLQFSERM